jgi:hypothetical protein
MGRIQPPTGGAFMKSAGMEQKVVVGDGSDSTQAGPLRDTGQVPIRTTSPADQNLILIEEALKTPILMEDHPDESLIDGHPEPGPRTTKNPPAKIAGGHFISWFLSRPVGQ